MKVTVRKTHFLFPAALFVSPAPYQVTTILGSCVAVCLWDPVTRIGGINHYMLPLWNGEGLPSPKFGNIAIEKLVDKMVALGARRSRLVAKVFGGAESLEHGSSHFMIGYRNGILARELLSDLSIPIISSDLGGVGGKKIQFFTDTGDVLLKQIKSERQSKP